MIRMGLGVDVVGYSARSAPMKADLHQRLATLVRDILGDLDLSLTETDHKGTGDGIDVFLPPTTEIHCALPHLLRAWQEPLVLDNQRFRDRMRLLMATVVGPVGLAATGFSEDTIVEVGRLLTSSVLAKQHPDADLAVLVSDQLYQYVIGAGHPGPRFHSVEITIQSG
jgi:class 3 adenylate cyclase